MHVPSVSDYKTNRGGRKKKERDRKRRREKLHRLEKTILSSSTKLEFLHITFLTNVLFRERYRCSID